jgi:hypothetical protein
MKGSDFFYFSSRCKKQRLMEQASTSERAKSRAPATGGGLCRSRRAGDAEQRMMGDDYDILFRAE